jgi:hypothetical protein
MTRFLRLLPFIKRSWPIGLRASQAMLKPAYAGMPPEASRATWKFPPTCRETLARAASTFRARVLRGECGAKPLKPGASQRSG